ncbi:hypothetical protein [Anaerorhabdus furcosa]|uniref:Uncharacterized protein n=1 Tax=Anaerorhabdus furcosa TaxID=118967 RepID=A0A1T4LZ77_9FIRM|nr:hypothetical protein [Anaerorhabdus furcosa]SJZ59965.1 hypothetical protein SAMN02745191_1116 [Anaerorhabdus furcosa]
MPKMKQEALQKTATKKNPVISNDDKLVQDLIKISLRYMKKHRLSNEQVSAYKYGLTKQVNKCSYVGSISDE